MDSKTNPTRDLTAPAAPLSTLHSPLSTAAPSGAALVTGASGFLGKHLVRRLLDADPQARVRVFSRGPFPLTGPGMDRVETICGDIADADAVREAAAGCARIYHLAGVVQRSPADPWTAYRTHVEGTRNICEAMRAHPVERCVVVSSSGTIAVGKTPRTANENSPYTHDIVKDWPYYLSKIYQEKQALWHYRHHKLPIVIVNPSLLLGPGDERGSSTNDVRLFLEGQIRVLPTGGLNLVDVRDAAAGIVAAMEKGSLGERYLLAGENLTFHEWIRLTAKLSGLAAPKFMLPTAAARTGAALLRALYPLFGKTFELEDASIRMSALFWYCDASKARRELGFAARPTEETLRDTIDDIRRRARGAAAAASR